MPKTASRAVTPDNPDSCALALKWIYSVMLDLDAYRQMLHLDGFRAPEIARELGLQQLVDETEADGAYCGPPFQARVQTALRQARRRFDKAHPAPPYPDQLGPNLTQLAQLIGLDEIEQQLLGFCALQQTDGLLDDSLSMLGYLGFNRLLRILSTLLAVPQAALRERLSGNSRLVRSGLLEATQRHGPHAQLSNLLRCSNNDLLFALRHHRGHAIGLFSSAFRKAPAATLATEDYGHLDTALGIARPYLRQALAKATAGVNVLIYGPPGTGKSQLTRLLARELDIELFEIACTDTNGDPIDRRGRLCALRAALSVLEQQRTLLVMDEIEDLFASGNPLFMDAGDRQKGWINRMLEENPLPCFWLTNDLDALDNAYIRRFDLILKLDIPPKAQRERIIRRSGGERLGQALVEQLVAHEQLMPAVITRALNVANRLEADSGPALDNAVTYLVDATLSAQGFERLAQNRLQRLPEFYNPSLSNTDLPLASLLEGLRNHGEARLCFYGPPGTGKTAFGHWLAGQLGRPLLTKRASDLIAPYLGMTEQNFARAFAQASDAGAVLLFDEVDSFLQDRRKAHHSWEISAVNEMLTQMEAYRGLFIASTNLIQDLDEASLRRFDLKIHFGYLSADQLLELLHRHLQQLGLKQPRSLALARLLRQSGLTPGDFALVARRARFSPFADADQLIDALLAESALKSVGQSRPIGFIH